MIAMASEMMLHSQVSRGNGPAVNTGNSVQMESSFQLFLVAIQFWDFWVDPLQK